MLHRPQRPVISLTARFSASGTEAQGPPVSGQFRPGFTRVLAFAARLVPSRNDYGARSVRHPSDKDDVPLQVVVGPFTGKPHPTSEVEQTVYQEIIADPELRGLFEYNQPLTPLGGKSFIVDLLWRQGRLIVELDGPEHHGHMAYVRDRDRDYRFLMDGYHTLRVPNAEVYTDVRRVLEKIRNVVRKLTPRTEGPTES